MTTYNNMFSIAFTMTRCPAPDIDGLTREQIRAAILRRVNDLFAHDEFAEGCELLDSIPEQAPEPEDVHRGEV